MSLFYKSFIQSVLTFTFIAWYGDNSVKDRNQMSHIEKVAGKLIGTPQTPLAYIFEERVVRKAKSILDCKSHPLHQNVEVLLSGRTFPFCTLANF